MKKKIIFMFALLCTVFLYSSVAATNPKDVKDEEDRIAFSKAGGTTRSATTAVVEGAGTRDLITLTVQNYRGGVWVEIFSSRGGVVHSYFDVFDMGFGVVNVSSLRSGKYTVRVILETGDTYTGDYTKTSYGR